MTKVLVEFNKNELFILQSALNYMSAAEEQHLREKYGEVVRLYDKISKHHDALDKMESCDCRTKPSSKETK